MRKSILLKTTIVITFIKTIFIIISSSISIGIIINTSINVSIIIVIIIIITTTIINLFNVDNQNMQIMCIVKNSYLSQAC